MNLPEVMSLTNQLPDPQDIRKIIQTNHQSQKYGLYLSNGDVLELIASRNRSLADHNRVELGMDVVIKLIDVFCSSPYINQEEYASTLQELADIFYYIKNISADKIGDADLINLMASFYNHSCHGSLELLKHREMAMIAQLISKT